MASKKDAIGTLYASRRYLYFPFHGAKQRNVEKLLKIGHFTVVFLVAKPLIWSEAEGDLVVLETRI